MRAARMDFFRRSGERRSADLFLVRGLPLFLALWLLKRNHERNQRQWLLLYCPLYVFLNCNVLGVSRCAQQAHGANGTSAI